MRSSTAIGPLGERATGTLLIAALVWAVVAFGGTEAWSFSLVQLLLLGLALGWLLAWLSGRVAPVEVPLLLPVLWVALVLLQRMPLPRFVVEAADRAGSLPPNSATGTLSLAPYETQAGLLLWATYLAGFYLTVVLARRRQGRKRLVFALVFLGIFEALFGLAQSLGDWQPLQRYVGEGLHPVGTYINANHFAGLLEMTLPFVLALAVYEARVLGSSVVQRAGFLRVILSCTGGERVVGWLFLGVLLVTAVAATQSRMGVLAALASVFLLLVLVASQPSTRPRAILLVVFLSVAALLMVWAAALEPLLERFEAVEYQFSLEDDHGRWVLWEDTLQLIGRHPWLGGGLGAFPDAYRGVQTAFPGKTVLHAHNDYLQVAAEMGLPGAGLMFGSFFYLLGAAVRTFRRAESSFEQTIALGCAGSLAAILIHSLADFNLQIPANALVFSVVLGLAYASSRAARRAGQSQAERA